MYSAAMIPLRVGSSLKDSNALPPRGLRQILIVGANRQTELRALVSAASSRAASVGRVGEKVAAMAVALGRTTAGAE
jgi:hypothetical protein